MFRFSRRRGKLCPGAGKAVSRRWGKVTFIHCREKCVGFPGAGGSCVPAPESSGASVGFPGNCVPAPRKLFPGAGERSHSFSVEEKCVGFPGGGGSCVPAPESSRARFWGSGARFQRECRFSRRRGKLCARRRGKVAFIHYRRKIRRFSR